MILLVVSLLALDNTLAMLLVILMLLAIISLLYPACDHVETDCWGHKNHCVKFKGHSGDHETVADQYLQWKNTSKNG